MGPLVRDLGGSVSDLVDPGIRLLSLAEVSPVSDRLSAASPEIGERSS